jgi:hypothetical protein
LELAAAEQRQEGLTKRLADANAEHAKGALAETQARRGKALISGWIKWAITAVAAAADYAVLSSVFQKVDLTENLVTAQFLAFAVSSLIMLGGAIVGKALWRRSFIRADAAERVGDSVLSIVLGLLLLALSVLVALMRASVSEQEANAQGFLLSTRMASGLGFIAIQTSAYALAVAAAYFGHRNDSTRDDGYVARARLRGMCRKADRAVTTRARSVLARENEEHAFESVARSERNYARARIADARASAFALLCGRQGLGSHHGAELAGSYIAASLADLLAKEPSQSDEKPKY